jgi:cytochrome c
MTSNISSNNTAGHSPDTVPDTVPVPISMTNRGRAVARRVAAMASVAGALAAAAPAAVGAAPLAAPQAVPAGDPVAGKAAFAACMSCHAVGPAARSGFGPQLNGVFGRQAGSLPGYSYSPAMKNARIVWNQATLAAFIDEPGAVVPGTKMRFYSLGFSERKIADLLAYLRTFPAPP